MGGVYPQYLVANEAMALMSMMRKSNKWVQSGISAILGSEDEPLAHRMGLRSSSPVGQTASPPLLHGFTELCNGNPPADNLEILNPFLRVIRSPHTSGTLTLRALISVDKFLTHVLSPTSPDIGESLYQIALAVTHCRFEAHDHAENDAVLHQIMAVMVTLVCGPLGPLLCNQGLCEVVETCMSMACHMRRGELLLRNANQTLVRLLVTIFGTMPYVPAPENNAPELEVEVETLKDAAALKDAVTLESEPVSRAETPRTGTPPQGKQDTENPVSFDPYDSNALLQIFRVTTSLLEQNGKYTDKTRLMMLQLLCRVFETAGVSISNDDRFVEIISLRLFRYIAELIRSSHSGLVAESLRLCTLVVETGPDLYLSQLQFVLVYLLRCLSPLSDLPRDANIDRMFYDGVPSRPKCVKVAHSNQESIDGPIVTSFKSPEIREIMVESITRMVHIPDFLAKLFVRYDCDVHQHNMCEDMIGFLCRNAYPDTATWSTASVPPLCLESLLSLLNSFYKQMGEYNQLDSHSAKLMAIKSRKGEEIATAELFNRNPKKGIQYAIDNKIISSESPHDIAEFIHHNQRLNGAALGEYLAKNQEVYLSFLQIFNFTNQRMDEALRELLAHFRLPGESALIEKLLDNLAEFFVNQPHDPKIVMSKDAAFVLFYAIIMLNTNLYNPQVKSPMTVESFKSQVKGTNDNGDFPPEYLEAIYKAIAKNEIIFPDEHDNAESFERSWNDLEVSLLAFKPAIHEYNSNINGEIFSIMWKPIVSTLAFIFATATDDLVFSRVITGIQRTAALAAKFNTVEALDHIIECLGKISILGSGDLATPLQNIEVKIATTDAVHSVIVSDLSVAFGSDLKAQMASITLFRIIEEVEGRHIGAIGAEVLARIFANLYLYDLVVPIEDMDRIPPSYTFERSKSGKNVGIFSALSSYLTANADTPAEPSDEDVDAALSAQDCIQLCNVAGVVQKWSGSVGPSGVTGIQTAIPDAGTGEQYHAGILFLIGFLARVADPTAQTSTRDFIKGLKLPPKLNGSVQNVLLKLGTPVKDLELDASALKDYLSALLATKDPQAWDVLSNASLESLSKQQQDQLYAFAIDTSNYPPQNPKSAMLALANLAEVGESDGRALDLLYDLKEKVTTGPDFIEFLHAAIIPCTSANAAIRERSLDKLQSSVQTFGTVQKYQIEWQAIFTECMIPLLDSLLRPQVFKRDPKNMGSTRVRAASIACKTFLTLGLDNAEGMQDVWVKLLHVLDRLLSSRKQASLHEGIEENLKNVILVLKTSDKPNEEFWQETHKALKNWMPELADLVE